MNAIKTLTNITPVNASFYLTFLALFGTTAATVIASFYPGSQNNADNKILADALLLETVVNFIATYFYSIFVSSAESGVIDVKNITPYRYLDWALTTPFLISAAILYFHYFRRKVLPSEKLNFRPLLLIIPINWLMLYFGYRGEAAGASRNMNLMLGFACFALVAALLWSNYVHKEVRETRYLFFFFLLIWGAYGVAFLFKDKPKNIMYNILDLISKVSFSLATIFVMIQNNHS